MRIGNSGMYKKLYFNIRFPSWHSSGCENDHLCTSPDTPVTGVDWEVLCANWGFQFSSVAQSCLTLCNPMDCSTPGFPVHHQLPEFNSNSCPSSRWCHPTISSSVIPSPPAFSLSQHRGLFKDWTEGLAWSLLPPCLPENQPVCYSLSVLPRAPVGIFELSAVNLEEPQDSSFSIWIFFPLYHLIGPTPILSYPFLALL